MTRISTRDTTSTFSQALNSPRPIPTLAIDMISRQLTTATNHRLPLPPLPSGIRPACTAHRNTACRINRYPCAIRQRFLISIQGQNTTHRQETRTSHHHHRMRRPPHLTLSSHPSGTASSVRRSAEYGEFSMPTCPLIHGHLASKYLALPLLI